MRLAAPDLVPATLRYPYREGETFSVRFSAGHRWRYLRGMEPEEDMLIKRCVSDFMLVERMAGLTCTSLG